MPGNAKTDKFLLSTATVMVGPVTDLHKLMPATHSIGLVKNVSLTTEPNFVELTQGINSQVVASTKTVENVSLTMEVYEYTLRNLAYAAGLDGSGIGFDALTDLIALDSAPAGGATDIDLTGDLTSSITAGTFIFIQEGTDDKVHIAKVADSTVATGVTTVDLATGYEIPSGGFTANARVGRVKRIDVGAPVPQAELAAKIVGVMPKTGEPVVLMIPKMKITGGISLAFQTDNYGNLPFKITPYAGVPTDPFYADYGPIPFALFSR